MGIKNPSGLLTQIANLPAEVETVLPDGAPKVSAMIKKAAGQLSNAPDFPVEFPDLPTVPDLPEIGSMPAGGNGGVTLGKKRMSRNDVTQTEVISSPASGVIPEVITRRGM